MTVDMVRNITKYARYGMTIAWVIAGGWLAGATAGEVRHAWYVVPTPPEVIKDVTIRNVRDEQGNKATFRIMLFSDEFRWRINSFDAVEAESGKRPQFTEEMKAVLNSASEIIAVGASSEEIPPGTSFPEGRVQGREARRAPRRENCRLDSRSAQPADSGPQVERRPPRADRLRRHVRSAPRRDHPGARS